MLQVVRVRSEEMDQVLIQPVVGEALRRSAEAACEGHRCNLRQASARRPAMEQFRLLNERRISLRVREDGRDTGDLYFIKDLVHLIGNEEVREFNEQIVRAVDGVIASVLAQAIQIFKREVEITAEKQLGLGPGGGLQLREFRAVHLRIKRILII